MEKRRVAVLGRLMVAKASQEVGDKVDTLIRGRGDGRMGVLRAFEW